MKPTADLRRFYEAAETFRQRAKVPHEVAKEIIQAARAKSIILTSKHQLDMALDVYRASERARAAGISFTDFKAAVRESLPKQAQRLTTLFRESVQTSYMQGRVEALSEPGLLLARPFWRFTAILDSVTTIICQACHDTTLPAHHPWWATHTPKLHFRCRSTIVSLTPQQAKAYGVDRRPTRVEPQEWESKDGTDRIEFGRVGTEHLPNISKMPAGFRQKYEAKVARVMAHLKEPKATRRKTTAPPIDKPATHS